MSEIPVAPESDIHVYDRWQRLFHWLMALIILVAIGLGLWGGELPSTDPLRRTLLGYHKSLGMTAFVLAIARLAYRHMKGEPPYQRPLPPHIQKAAHIGHILLYALMFFMPVTGYLLSGAGGYSLSWFGLFSLPRLVPQDKGLSEFGAELHEIGAWAICILLAGHIGAALWHHYFIRDETLTRMIPRLRSRQKPLV